MFGKVALGAERPIKAEPFQGESGLPQFFEQKGQLYLQTLFIKSACKALGPRDDTQTQSHLSICINSQVCSTKMFLRTSKLSANKNSHL